MDKALREALPSVKKASNRSVVGHSTGNTLPKGFGSAKFMVISVVYRGHEPTLVLVR